MDKRIRANDLFARIRQRLSVTWLEGHSGGDRVIHHQRMVAGDEDATVGFLNFIRPNQIQLLGATEIGYLRSLGKNSFSDVLGHLFARQPAVVMVTENQQPPPAMVDQARGSHTPLWVSPVNSEEVLDYMQYVLANVLARATHVHGVFLEVLGIGVLLEADSGAGKSELALELISRGHRLIADDAPELIRVAPDTIKGCCPEVLQDFLEVRGLGVLNIRAMFGDNAIKKNKVLRLIVQLERMNDRQMALLDRLRGNYHSRDVLGVTIPCVTLPVVTGSNLAVLVEGVVRNHLLRENGYCATDRFISRHREFMVHK